MRQRTSLVMAVALLTAALSTGAGAKTGGVDFSLKGEARALEIALGDQGLTAGFSLTQVDSTPSAIGVGAGQCEVLGSESDPDDLPCNEATTQTATLEDAGEDGDTCAGPTIPDPLGQIVTIAIACGSANVGLKDGMPVSDNLGKVEETTLSMDLSPLSPQAEDAKDDLIDAIQEITGGAPDQIGNAVDALADALSQGQGAHIQLGPASTTVTRKGAGLKVTSSAAGALIGVAGIPDLDGDGNPIAGTSDALEDGLIIVEVGRADSSAWFTGPTADAAGAANAALVTVKVRDITQVDPTYVEISVEPGETVTVLEGTPAESTIVAADSTVEQEGGAAAAVSTAVSLHLLKGVQGGLKLALGQTSAAAQVQVATVVQPKAKDPKTLPLTGGPNLAILGLSLMSLAGLALAARRRI